jgi:hypothetical protein
MLVCAHGPAVTLFVLNHQQTDSHAVPDQQVAAAPTQWGLTHYHSTSLNRQQAAQQPQRLHKSCGSSSNSSSNSSSKATPMVKGTQCNRLEQRHVASLHVVNICH